MLKIKENIAEIMAGLQEQIRPVMKKAAEDMAKYAYANWPTTPKPKVKRPNDGTPKYWDVKNSPVYPDEPAERYQMRKWLSQVPQRRHSGRHGRFGGV